MLSGMFFRDRKGAPRIVTWRARKHYSALTMLKGLVIHFFVGLQVQVVKQSGRALELRRRHGGQSNNQRRRFGFVA